VGVGEIGRKLIREKLIGAAVVGYGEYEIIG
jgi:hypothetical protein